MPDMKDIVTDDMVKNALKSDAVTTAVKTQIKSTLDQQIDAAVDTALTDILGSDDDNPVKASKAELDSVLGVQDLWDLLEIIQVDAHNERVMQETQNGSGT